MPIDARIPLGVNPAPTFDILGAVGRAAQIKRLDAISQNEQQELALKQKAEATKEQVKGVLSKYQGDLNKALPEIFAIDPETGMKIQKTSNDAKESDYRLKTAKLGHDRIVAEEVGRKVQGVTDQDSYGYFLADLKGSGLPTEGMPPTYDPAYVESLKTKSLTVLENAQREEKRMATDFAKWKAEQDQRDKDADNKRADDAAAETRRHNRVVENKPTGGESALVAIVGPDGKPVLVPRSQAVGKTPAPTGAGASGAKLSAGQEQELEGMLTASDLAAKTIALGNKIGWKGVGAFGQGTMGEVASKFGGSSDDERSLRNNVSNIQATIAKIRGGTAFSAQEKKMLDRYTPTINDAPADIRQKLTDLSDFIEMKRKNMVKIASGDLSPNAPAGGGGGAKTDPLGIR